MKWRTTTVLLAASLAMMMPAKARATGPLPLAARQCSEQIENRTRLYIDAVGNEVRNSIAANLRGNNSVCSGPFVCTGGPKNNLPCANTAFCGSAGGVPFQCRPRLTAGIINPIRVAKGNLRTQLTSLCSDANLAVLYGGSSGSSRCADPGGAPGTLSSTELLNCILRDSVGHVSNNQLRGTVGELLGVGAPNVAVDAPMAKTICAVGLGAVTEIGSTATLPVLVDAAASIDVLSPDGCTAGNPLCNTKGRVEIGSSAVPPQQTFAGMIPICITRELKDAGNGTSEVGSIRLNTGEQHSKSVEDVTISIGVVCPICDKASSVCTAGPHVGYACTNGGETDVACPPALSSTPPVLHLILERTTDTLTLAAPAHNPAGGVVNPAGAMCGSCDADDSVSCSKDADCSAHSVCAGGTGCCVFGANAGAFGNSLATDVQASGTRGPFLPSLVGLACIGKTGDLLVDDVTGLPGPMRSFQLRLNAFTY